MIDPAKDKLEKLLSGVVSVYCKKAVPEIRYCPNREVFSLRVNHNEHGRCVGKQGIGIWALNAVMYYASMAQARKVIMVELLEPVGTGARHKMPFKLNKKWDRKLIGGMLDLILDGCFKDKCPWVIEDTADGEAVINIQLPKYLQTPCSDPSIAEAIETLVRVAGMANGCILTCAISWN